MTITSTTKSLCEEKSLLESWLHRWGCSISEAILDSECNIFRTADINGFIGYRLESDCAIMYGDPICAIDDKPRLAHAFHHYCQEKNMNMACIAASEQFAKWAIKDLCHVMIEVGQELIFDPQHDPTEGPKGHKLRYKVNHLLHNGLQVHEYLASDAKLEQAMEEVAATWLKVRRGPQIYLSNLKFFDTRIGRRWFYVKNGDHIIGVAMLSRRDANRGWLLKFLIVVPKAPYGTSELLTTSILETLRKENCHFLTYGMVTSDRLGEMIGIGKCSAWFARFSYKIIKWIFKLNHRNLYWQKFHPQTRPLYLLFGKPHFGWQEIRALMQSLKIKMK